MSEDPQNILPTKKTKLWKNNVKKDESWKPLTPNFCPYVDPETDNKCGKFMHRWDVMFYDDYGMCEECYLKHKPTEKIDG